ncbi:MAG: MogA/MoaB family molybdenum cofactor biosynthesis protein [Clostridiales bacterium]|nr:MogA/MoaB family molybdenum cofactor biosynthesis protein [Clostridiales bacterium]
MQEIRAAILILSDKAFAGERADACAPLITQLLQGVATVTHTAILPDEKQKIIDALTGLADRERVDIIITSGGTGLAPRDVTPDATLAVIDKPAPGIAEAMRMHSMRYTDKAMLSRAAAGIRGGTLIINLPGSPKAVRECLDVVLPVIPHAIETLRGAAYECGAADPRSETSTPL